MKLSILILIILVVLQFILHDLCALKKLKLFTISYVNIHYSINLIGYSLYFGTHYFLTLPPFRYIFIFIFRLFKSNVNLLFKIIITFRFFPYKFYENILILLSFFARTSAFDSGLVSPDHRVEILDFSLNNPYHFLPIALLMIS